MVIAIDGPAGAGKSSVARAVAAVLGFTFLDSGAMYRAAALAGTGDAEIAFDGDRVLLDGRDVSGEIRAPEISEAASRVAADPAVRAALVLRQQALMGAGDWVAEGRDIGTVVWPQAELKVYLTAEAMERARRRAEQIGAELEDVLAEQADRDERDRTREHSPLVAADDAVEVDTTGLSFEQVVERIVALAQERR
jgi:cytidylate kinase